MLLCLTSVNEYRTGVDSVLLDEWIGRLARGDASALAALYQEAGGAVYGFALSILKNTSDAEDVLHDCFLSVYSAAGEYRANGKPMAWIMTVARNLCFQKLRERRRISDIPQEDWEPYLQKREGVTPEDRMILSECMRSLSDEERQIVALHAAAGFKHREIAGFLDIPLPTVLSKYSRALRKLNKFLEKGERT